MLQLNSAPSRSYLNATRANAPTGHADDASKSFPSPSITLESTAFIWAGMATRDCYLATSVDQPGGCCSLSALARSQSPRQATSRILRGAEDARRVYRLRIGADFGFWHEADVPSGPRMSADE